MSVPFNIDAGLRDVSGTIRIQEQALVLEFKVSDGIFHMLHSEIKEVAIPFSEVESVMLATSWFGLSAALKVRTKTMKVLEGVPGDHHSELCVKIARKDREIAKEFVSQANFGLSETKLKMLHGSSTERQA